MSPDANKLRQRNPSESLNDGAGANANVQPLADGLMDSQTRTLKNLKGHEAAIDGVVYDLRSFQHPGGDSIFIFGGNDATVQYRMIHPFHTGNKHLEKLKKVGTIPGYVCE